MARKRKSKIDKVDDFIVEDKGSYYLVRNTKMKFQEKSGHTHISKKHYKNAKSCSHKLVYDICNRTVPTDYYLQESAKRISRDEYYIALVEVKQERDQNKPKYYNVNRGAVC